MKSYDLIAVGGGSAGYAAARVATGLGAKVAVVEGGREVEGLCILRGCMPAKALLESAHRLHEINRAGEFGISVGKAKPDWRKIVARKDRLIEDFASYRRGQLERGKFDFIRGRAEFIDPHTLAVSGLKDGKKTRISGRAFVISTGSVVGVRELPGLREAGFITSDEALRLQKPLKSLAVLGGGAVALEFAQYFQHLGVKVTLIQRSKQVLSRQDADYANVLTEVFRKQGMKVYLGAELIGFKKTAKGKQVVFKQNGRMLTVTAGEILYALGREPNVSSLALDRAGVELQGKAVKAAETMQTSQCHIFAAGDVCGPHEVVHMAIRQGEVAARNALRFLRRDPAREKMDYRLKMEAVFTEPELAAIGMSEKEAATLGRKTLTAKYPFNDHGKSMIMGAGDGFVKIIADTANGEILGAQVAGPRASDLIHEFAVAMHYRSNVKDFLSIPHYHPTLAEIATYPAEEIAGQLPRS
jgi:pyruvate/2-oxoglutarate dehydrogenase complex dihydrolipoamide dehydrogenase (E3) component